MNLRDYITIDSDSLGGEACITGTSVPVSAILEKLAEGLDADEILRSFPSVSRDAIKAAVLFAAEMAKNPGVAHDHLLSPLSRDDVLQTLREHKATLAEQFGVTDLAIFGSFARGQNTESSDLDILVSFNKPATSESFFGVQFYIEDLLGCRVDLVTQKALRPEFRPYVEREAIRV